MLLSVCPKCNYGIVAFLNLCVLSICSNTLFQFFLFALLWLAQLGQVMKQHCVYKCYYAFGNVCASAGMCECENTRL